MHSERLPPASLVGRILMASLFLASGLAKLAAPAATKAYIVATGLPLPDLAYIASLAIELGLGLLLLLGYQTRLVAAVLAVFALVTALVFHRHFGDANQQVHFLKNLAISGGLLQFAACGAGRYSMDARRRFRPATL